MKYTKAVEAAIVQMYKEKQAKGMLPQYIIEDILSEFPGFTEHSVIAKLSSLGIHKKRPYTNKLGELPCTKTQLVDELATIMGIEASVVDSLDKVNKGVLKVLVRTLKHRYLTE